MSGLFRFGSSFKAIGPFSTPRTPAAPTLGTPPAVTLLPLITGTAISGQTLSCSTGSWANIPISFGFAWTRNTALISAATTSTYALTDDDVGTSIACIVTAINAAGSVSATAISVGPVGSLAPVNTVLPLITGTAQDGQTLSVSNGTWTNSPVSYIYQWKRNGSAISGETSNSYAVVTGDVGSNITCSVSAQNAHGFGTVTSAAAGPILPAVPVNTVAPVISGTGTQGQTLTVTSNGAWTNSPTSFTFQWKRNGTNIAGETNSTYFLAAADIGATVTCSVTAINAGGSAAASSNGIGPIGSASGITAPVIALHTASGASPASWDVTGDSTFQPGMWVHLQFAPNNIGDFTGTVVDYYTQVEGPDWEADSESIGGAASVGIAGAAQTFTQPSGPYSVRPRFETNPGDPTNNVTSPWGNTVSDTITTSSAVLSASDKNNSLVLDSSYQAHVSANTNAATGVRSSIAQVNQKGHQELTINEVDGFATPNGSFILAIADSANPASLAATFSVPGAATGFPGASLQVRRTTTTVTLSYNGSGHSATLSSLPAVGDTLSIDHDYSAHTVHFRYLHGSGSSNPGTIDDLGTITMTSQIPTTPKAFCAGYCFTSAGVTDQFTWNPGNATFAITPDTGFGNFG